MIWDFLLNNKDTIETIATIIGALTAVGSAIWGALKFWQSRRIRGEVSVFELITDREQLLLKLYNTENDDSPFADHKINYQPRTPGEDLQAKLKTELNFSRYLLITAPTGYGKTREAGMLAQTMMLEGWRVLRIKSGWLDAPKTLPEQLGGNRSRVLIFLDDLNGLFRAGNLTQSPRMGDDKSFTFRQPSYHDRLLSVLDYFETACAENEIRVLATARDETDEWKVLDFDENDSLWRRFTRVKLGEPADTAVVQLLKDAIKESDLKGEENGFEIIAHRNDGSYYNILLNLRRWQAENKEITPSDFTDTLAGSWREVYERVARKHPDAQYIYLSIFLARYYQIPLQPHFIEPLALRLAHKSHFARVWRRSRIRKTLQYLATKEHLLSPRDGQMEGCPLVQNAQPLDYIELALKVLISTGFFRAKEIAPFAVFLFLYLERRKTDAVIFNLFLLLLFHFPIELLAIALSFENKKKKAAEILNGKRNKNVLTSVALSTLHPEQANSAQSISVFEQEVKANPQAYMLHFGLGNQYYAAGRYQEAESCFRNAIKLNPPDFTPYNNLGNVLRELNRYEEAEAYFRKAIEIDPAYAIAYKNLGLLLHEKLNRYEEAEINYRKAIEFDPTDADTYKQLGIVLEKLNRYKEAETNYRKAIDLNPSDAGSYSNLGLLLHQVLNRYEEAESCYRKGIELSPSDANYYAILGLLLYEKTNRYEEAETYYRKAIELNPSEASFYYGLGKLLHEKMNRYEEAETYYRKAIESNISEASYYNSLGILLHDKLNRHEEAETCFRKAVALNPLNADFHCNLGIALHNKPNSHEEAEASYRKAIELNPSDANYYFSLGILLYGKSNRQKEAEANYRKAIELNPSDSRYHVNLGILLVLLHRYKEADACLRKAIKLNPSDSAAHLGVASIKRILGENTNSSLKKARQHTPKEDFYGWACVESVGNNVDLAFEYLQKAAQQKNFNSERAWQSIALQWIRDDPRFEQIVGKKPS